MIEMFEEIYVKDHPAAAVGAARFIGSDFSASGPSVRSVAEGFGVPVVSIESGGQLEASVDDESRTGPVLLHVPIDD